MEERKFYQELSEYIKSRDSQNANRVIMRELGRILVKDKNDFVLLLKYSGIPAENGDTDASLIDKFIANLPGNRKLLIGSAFLTSHHNKTMSFDGEEEICDAGVKATHKVMLNYFYLPEDNIQPDATAPEDYLYAEGGLWGAIAGAVGEGAKFGGKIADNQRSKKQGGMDLLNKKQDAKQEMIKSALEQRNMQQQAALKEKEIKSKNTKIIIIASVSLLAVVAIVGTIIYVRKK